MTSCALRTSAIVSVSQARVASIAKDVDGQTMAQLEGILVHKLALPRDGPSRLQGPCRPNNAASYLGSLFQAWIYYRSVSCLWTFLFVIRSILCSSTSHSLQAHFDSIAWLYVYFEQWRQAQRSQKCCHPLHESSEMGSLGPWKVNYCPEMSGSLDDGASRS